MEEQKRPADKTIVFEMDADMIAYPGLLANIYEHTREGDSVYCPIVYSTWGNPDDWYEGAWRNGGTGMIGFFLSDFHKAGGRVPAADKARSPVWWRVRSAPPLTARPLSSPPQTTYGDEDDAFLNYMIKSRIKIAHRCETHLWHLFHTKEVSAGLCVRSSGRSPHASPC